MTLSSARERSKAASYWVGHTHAQAQRRSFSDLKLVCYRWFCHVDDDNYLNVGALLKLLSQYSHTQDVYIGRPSLERPIQATEQIGPGQTVNGLFCKAALQYVDSGCHFSICATSGTFA